MEPLFPRPVSAGGGDLQAAAGAEAAAELSEAHAACCRGACEVLRGVCGWAAQAPAHHSAALQPLLVAAVGSAVRGLSVVGTTSLGLGPGGWATRRVGRERG